MPVTGATRNRYHNAIRVFARWLLTEHDGILEFNPATVVRKAKERTDHVIYSPAEVRKLVVSLTGEARALSALMAGTGMEWQAIERVTRRDVDFYRKTVHTHGAKNDWRNRTNSVTEEWAWRIFAAWARTISADAPVFTIGYKVALKAHHAACRALGLPKTTLHNHRGHYAVMLRRRGVSDVVIARRLGHHDTQLVARRYGRYQPEVAEVTRAAGGLRSHRSRRVVPQ
jgi:integrase